MKVFEAIGNALNELGVDEIFGLMGDGNLKLLTCWTDQMEKSYHGTRHESAAIGMADGYFRATGYVGVCTVTQGPGVTNALTALTTARKASSQILMMSGDVSSAQVGWPQDIDHTLVYIAAGIPVVQIEDPSSPFSDIVKAYRLAQSRGGPVAVNMPIDVQEMDWLAWNDEPSDVSEAQLGVTSASSDDIQRASRLLLGARKPVIIAGRGAAESGCEPQLRAIAERTGSLLSTTLRGKGLFSGDPYLIGIAGGLGTNLCAKLIGEADVALVVGAGMNDFTTMHQTLLANSATVINCDIKPRGLGRPAGELCELPGDAGVVIPELLRQIDEDDHESEGYRTALISDELKLFTPQSEIKLADDTEYLDPRLLTIRLNELLPKNRAVVTDAGHFFGNPCTYMDVSDARSFVCGIDFGSIGLGIGHAMGVCVANSNRPIVLFVGDGGLQMSLGDLETVARYQFPLIVVVMNDAAYGSELQIMKLWDLPTELSVFPNTDFAGVAKSLGLKSYSIKSLDDLNFLENYSVDDGPILLDCAISRMVRAAWLDEAFVRE
jgi:thiamine pyrophosphate-dependent acetolactate synthase large subunit-like protein